MSSSSESHDYYGLMDALEQKIAQLSRIRQENEELRRRVERAEAERDDHFASLQILQEQYRNQHKHDTALIERAEADNARLREALERTSTLLGAAGKAIGEDGWDMDFSHVDGISTDHIGFSTDCDNAVSDARALLSRLRAGEQEGWRLVPVEPTEAMIEARFHVLGQGGKAEWEAMLAAAPSERGGDRG
jgi:hypothetical protein